MNRLFTVLVALRALAVSVAVFMLSCACVIMCFYVVFVNMSASYVRHFLD